MDGITLVLDASTYEGSVALILDGRVVAERVIAMRGVHEERLMPSVASALQYAGVAPRSVTRFVCGAGPGSFTSLRIAAAIAKGLAFAANAPLYTVSSLALASIEAGTGRWLVTLDALRGDSYAACFEWNGGSAQELRRAEIVAFDKLDALAAELNATVVAARPHARAAVFLLDDIVAKGPVDLASWEPSYGRLAEAQVKWEAAHGQALGS